jgi:cytochrome c peroxidase
VLETAVGFIHSLAMAARWVAVFFCMALLMASVQAGIADRHAMSRTEAYQRASALATLGRMIFFDPALSASGRLSCASCHDPAYGFGPPNALAVQHGGKDMAQVGVRAVPSLKYLQATPQFTQHYFESEDEGDASIDNGPTGGLTWDGRVDRGRDQAKLPLLSSFEMANDDAAAVVAKVKEARYGGSLRETFGATIFDDTESAFAVIVQALEAYEQSYADFYPYSSKYDAYLAGKATLSAQEARGLVLFNEPAKGNCAHCHMSARGKDGTPPQFTDFGFAALGVPRNRDIPANGDSDHFDLGLCGPLRADLKDRSEYCGLFKAPTLRNVALRRTFFHNGVFHTLKEVLDFYATRDTAPEKWFARNADGSVRKFDDLPPQFAANVNSEPPFDRHAGDRPALSESEIEDIIAFLQTLNDGFRQ